MNARSLSLAVLVVLIAFGAWFALRDNGAPPPGPGMPGAAATNDPGAAPSVAEQTGRVAERGEVAASAVGAGDRSLAAQPSGSGGAPGGVWLRARLIDAAGAPRADVEVNLATWRDTAALPLPAGGRGDGKQPSTRSGKDGRFGFPIPRVGAGGLELAADDLVFANDRIQWEANGADLDLGDLSVVAAATVQGVVQDAQGAPVAGVKVTATQGPLRFGAASSATTAADGAFSLGKLRPAKWTLRTASGKFLPHAEELEIAAGERRTGVVVVLQAGAAIAGQVVDDLGVGVAGIRVGSKRSESHSGLAIERFTSDEAVRTDANGFFTLAGLEGERASVRAFGPGYLTAMATDVPVGTNDLVLRVDRQATIVGTLVDPAGKPIAGSNVWSASAGDRMASVDVGEVDDVAMPFRNRAETAVDGSFRLENVDPGTVSVFARGKGHREARVDGLRVVAGGRIEGVKLVGDPGAALQVRVRDGDGRPVANAAVRVRKAREAGAVNGFRVGASVDIEDSDVPMPIGMFGGMLGRGTTDAEGVVTIAGLEAGQVEVLVGHETLAPSRPLAVSVPPAGTQTVDVTLTEPGFAEVLVHDVDGKVVGATEVTIQATDDSGAEAVSGRTDEHGAVRLGPLAAGSYEASLVRGSNRGMAAGSVAVRIAGDQPKALDGSARRFTIVGGKTTQVELQQPVLARVHGTITGADGPMAGLRVRLVGAEDQGIAIPGFDDASGMLTGADGRYEFDGVEPGDYTLRFGKPLQVVPAEQPLRVPPQTADVLQDLVAAVGTLRVQVVAKGSGEPVAGAKVEVHRAAVPGTERREQRVMMVTMTLAGDDQDAETTTMTVGDQSATTDGEGWATIVDVPVGTYDLAISHKKFADASVKQQVVAAQQTTESGRCEMQAAGRLRGIVRTADGGVAKMALVATRPIDGSEWSPPEVAMGGKVSVGRLASGRYKVRAQSMGEGVHYGPEVEVEIRGGEATDVELRLP